MDRKPCVLVVDDEPNIRRILQVAFEKVGYAVLTAEDALQAERTLVKEQVDCVITDVTMPGKTGYHLLRDIRQHLPELPVIVMTAFGTIPQAIQAIRDGAFEFVTKPFDLDVLKKIVANALESGVSAPVGGTKPSRVARASTDYIAESPAMKQLFETVRQVADSRATVLITGESGVGKEVVAKALHQGSQRSKKPFVAVSCAALPESLLESELFGYEKGAFTGANGSKAGRFEMAHEGTLFLDEVGEIPIGVQVKLLRVLQEREFERLGAAKATRVDVRLITATNRRLMDAVEQGIFRLDLLYRLQVVEIEIPPLRERREDIVPLCNHFLAKYCRENNRGLLTVSKEAAGAMGKYRWPGNVRELENTMERAVVLSAPGDVEVLLKALPPMIVQAA